MPNPPRRTHYDELGVSRRASPQEIEKAWLRYRAEAGREDTAPDRVREARMKSAYDTLSRPERRELYDMTLSLPERKRRSKGLWAAILGVTVLGVVAGIAQLLEPPPPPPPGTVPVDELAHKATQAMARVDSTDVSGKAAPVGLAFAIDEGLVATTCNGISPMSQLSLYMAPRTVPVKVAEADETLGVCKLGAKGVGSWPLRIAGNDPSPGEIVYVTKMNAVGEVTLAEARVKRVVPTGRGKSIEISVAVLPERQGGPVLNSRGEVVGVQLLAGGKGHGEVVRVTPQWSERAKAPEPAAAPRAATYDAPKPAPDNAVERQVKTREALLEERRKAVDEAVKKSTE